MTGFLLLHSRKGKWKKINIYSGEKKCEDLRAFFKDKNYFSKKWFTVAPEGSSQFVLNYRKADDQVIIRITYVINDLELMVQISTELFFTRDFQTGFGRPSLWNVYL